MQLDTAHLRLISYTLEQIVAMFEGRSKFEAQMGMAVADGLCEMATGPDVSPEWLAELRAAQEADDWKHGFALVHRDENCVVGTCGFKGPPSDDGMVEIAYGIAPGYESRGYATEAAAELSEYAFATGRVSLVRAHTLPEANASTRVLTKCGFRHVGEVIDPEDGRVWRWELMKPGELP